MNYQTALLNYRTASDIQPVGQTSMKNALEQLNKLMPNGLAGGALAGGFMALLISNKSARQFASTTATIGGAALIGGLAYKAFKNWQHTTNDETSFAEHSFTSAELLRADYQLTLIKAMIAAARANHHHDDIDQELIVRAVDDMDLRSAEKILITNMLLQPIRLDELVQGAHTLKQKSEVYLVSCMIVDPADAAGQAYLGQLAERLELPAGLAKKIHLQARQAMGLV